MAIPENGQINLCVKEEGNDAKKNYLDSLKKAMK